MSKRTDIESRARQILDGRLYELHARTDRLFVALLVMEWVAAIAVALWLSPGSWSGSEGTWPLPPWIAVVLGSLLTLLPVAMVLFAPGRPATRLTIAVAQAGYSALFIHLAGGRIETYLHAFGSLALLTLYRDWRVLVPATLVVTANHAVRGVFWPHSDIGLLDSSLLPTVEFAAWVTFENACLIWSCLTGVREMRTAAVTQATLEESRESIDQIIEDRTRELKARTIELERSAEETQNMAQRLAQAQKLESIGQLAAGIAHEINTPMQFISDNSIYLQECMERLLTITQSYASTVHPDSPNIPWQERHDMVCRVLEECRYEELQREVPAALAENMDGIDRVVTIVRAMKDFSHPGTASKVPTDINQAIRSTATITRNRWKDIAEIAFELDSELPDVRVLPAELNQVFLNLIVNAADAIRERLGEEGVERGTITLRTFADIGHVVVEIEDDGAGIPDEIQSRVFDPFFTTKEVGQGTGQGLALCDDIVVNKHRGQMSVRSQQGVGTTIAVRLPIRCDPPNEIQNEEETALA